MSLQSRNWALYMWSIWASKLSPCQKIVLYTLADRADDNGVGHIPVSQIVDNCGLTKPTVRSAMTELYNLGLVENKGYDRSGTRYLIPTAPGFSWKDNLHARKVKPRRVMGPTAAERAAQAEREEVEAQFL